LLANSIKACAASEGLLPLRRNIISHTARATSDPIGVETQRLFRELAVVVAMAWLGGGAGKSSDVRVCGSVAGGG